MLIVGELEALLEAQNQALQKARVMPPINTFEQRRSSISTDPSFYRSTFPRHTSTQQYTPVYKEEVKREYRSDPESERTPRLSRPDSSAIDRLAHVAMTFPPVVNETSRRTAALNPDVDPNLGNPPISFPTFPHDIFNSGGRSYGTPPRRSSPVSSHVTWKEKSETQLLPYGSEADGLPSSETLEIMYAYHWFSLTLGLIYISSISIPLSPSCTSQLFFPRYCFHLLYVQAPQ